MIRRALLLSLALVALLAAPAAAQYSGPTAGATVAGDTIVVAGEGFIAGATVNYSVEFGGSVVETGTAVADAAGDVQFSVEVRGDGVHRITMTDGTNTAVASVTVGAAQAPAPAPTQGGTALPRTGADSSIGMAQIGFAALAIGSVSVYAAKRRKAKAFA